MVRSPRRRSSVGRTRKFGRSAAPSMRPRRCSFPFESTIRRGVTVNEETLKALCAAIEGARNACADLAFQTAYAPAPEWCRGTGLGRGFGARTEAFKVIGRDFLTANGLDGSGVNVVIVDHGLDANKLAGNFFGGWVVGSKVAGQLQYLRGVTGNYHGMLIARIVVAVAPQACLFDCPLIPGAQENGRHPGQGWRPRLSRPNGTGIGVYFFEMFQNSVTGALITPWRLSR